MASRGFAFVRYYSEREAEKAIDNLKMPHGIDKNYFLKPINYDCCY